MLVSQGKEVIASVKTLLSRLWSFWRWLKTLRVEVMPTAEHERHCRVHSGVGFEVSIRLVLIGFPVFFSMLGLGLALAGVRLVYQKIGSLPQTVWLVLFGTALAASSTTLYRASVWSSFAGGLLYVREGILQPTWFCCIFRGEHSDWGYGVSLGRADHAS